MLEIYIRKMRYQEAADKLEKELNQAFMNGVQYVRVVHGIGQGELKRMVAQKVREWGFARVLENDPDFANPGVTDLELMPPDTRKRNRGYF